MNRLIALCSLVMAMMVPASAFAFDEVEDPGATEPVPFQVVEEDSQNMARPRVVMRITVTPGGEKEIGAAIAQAVRDGLDSNGLAEVAHVFA